MDLLGALLGTACPDCPAAREARALALSEGFWVNAWYALLPFAIVVAIVRWVGRRVDGGRHETRSED